MSVAQGRTPRRLPCLTLNITRCKPTVEGRAFDSPLEGRAFDSHLAGGRLFAAAQRLVDRGAQTVLLGGTDLNVVFDGSEPVPVIDSAEVHVQAIVREALAP